MARLQKRGLRETRRALRWQAPSRFEIAVALAVGSLAAALTVLRSVRGTDPDTAAASGMALALGAFAGCLAIPVFMRINVRSAHWYGCRVLEPWAERFDRRQEAIDSRLDAFGSVEDAGGPPERAEYVWWDRFRKVVKWATYGSWAVFVLLFAQVVSRALLAASGLDGGDVHPVLIASLAVSGALSLLIFQTPLAALTWLLMRAGRVAGKTEKALDRLERDGAVETSRAMPAQRRPGLVVRYYYDSNVKIMFTRSESQLRLGRRAVSMTKRFGAAVRGAPLEVAGDAQADAVASSCASTADRHARPRV